MKGSIAQKITLTIVAVAVGGIVLAGLMANVAWEWNFRRYLSSVEVEQNQKILEALVELYSEEDAWSDVRHQVMQMGMTSGTQIRLYDQGGVLVIDSLPRMMMGRHGRRWQLAQEQRGLVQTYALEVADKKVGTVEITRLGQWGLWSPEALVFRRGVLLTAAGTGLVTVVVAIFAGSALARRMTVRLERLTRAAEKLGQGEVHADMAVEGDDELALLGLTMDRLAGRLSEQDRLRKKLTSDISHELRTPLATIQSYLEAFRDGVLPMDGRNLAAVLEESDRLARLVDDLQELSGAEPTGKRVELQAIELNGFLTREAALARPLFAQKGIELAFALGEVPVVVAADEAMLLKVLRNLLSNAHKYTAEGGKVELLTFATGEEAGFLVRDNGLGMEAEHLPHIFERFYRADQSRTRGTGGSGIGLAIVQELVLSMGGRVEVESEPGRGSLFRITLEATTMKLRSAVRAAGG
ncbi:MAG: Alkaline phosphatase synthesis sensor protein PhoR [Firmicutes bacterium]|nr:Alkaline phosphatase synthesis sensor protein PhoR [Bacillota bacterium]